MSELNNWELCYEKCHEAICECLDDVDIKYQKLLYFVKAISKTDPLTLYSCQGCIMASHELLKEIGEL